GGGRNWSRLYDVALALPGGAALRGLAGSALSRSQGQDPESHSLHSRRQAQRSALRFADARGRFLRRRNRGALSALAPPRRSRKAAPRTLHGALPSSRSVARRPLLALVLGICLCATSLDTVFQWRRIPALASRICRSIAPRGWPVTVCSTSTSKRSRWRGASTSKPPDRRCSPPT